MQKVRQILKNKLTALCTLFKDLFHLPTRVTFQLSLTVLCSLLVCIKTLILKSGLFFFKHNFRVVFYYKVYPWYLKQKI